MKPESVEYYNQLGESLDEMIKVYRSLLKVVRNEKDILASADLDDLNENNKSKEAMLIKLRQLEEGRVETARMLAASEGLAPEQARLLEFAKHFGGPVAERLRSQHSVLELLLKRVKEFNKQNEVLVSSALTNITGAMNSIRDTLKDKPTYQNKGGMDDKPARSGNFVSREV